MAELDEAKIAEIVSRVVARVLPEAQAKASEPFCAPAPPVYSPKSAPAVHVKNRQPGVFEDMDRAITPPMWRTPNTKKCRWRPGIG